jgi:hypothetical protein
MNDILRIQKAGFEMLWEQCAASFLVLYTNMLRATPASVAKLRAFFSEEAAAAAASIPAIWARLSKAFGECPEFETIKRCWEKVTAPDDPIHRLFFGPEGRIAAAWRAVMHSERMESPLAALGKQPCCILEPRLLESVGTMQRVAVLSLRIHAQRYNCIIAEQTRALFPQ